MSSYEIAFAESADEYKDSIRRLLVEADEEFVPPLSSRTSTTQTQGLDDDVELPEGISKYFRGCMEQKFVIALKDERLIGFLTFRYNYEHEYLKEFNPSNYVSTVIVGKKFRGRGIATDLYRKLLYDTPPNLKLPFVTTRTWSGNDVHNHLLEELGFEEVSIVENDRGEGIDTIYYAIRVNEYQGDLIE